MRYPCVKFIGHTMSFVTFLVMILVSSITAQPATQNKILSFNKVATLYHDFQTTHPKEYPKDFAVRISELEVIHLLLSLWIIGMSMLIIVRIEIQIHLIKVTSISVIFNPT